MRNTYKYIVTTCFNIKLMKLLLDNGANINQTDKTGNNLLLMAIKYNLVNVVKLIIESYLHLIDINYTNNDGDTALIRAASFAGSWDGAPIAGILLTCGEINKSNNNNGTALVWACYYGNINIVKMLLDRPDINLQNINNNCYGALCYAMYGNKPIVVEFLLERFGDDNKMYSVLENDDYVFHWVATSSHKLDISLYFYFIFGRFIIFSHSIHFGHIYIHYLHHVLNYFFFCSHILFFVYYYYLSIGIFFY